MKEISALIEGTVGSSPPQLHMRTQQGGRSDGLVVSSVPEFSTVCWIHAVKGFGIVNKEEIDVSLELSCSLNDPADVGNLICGSSAFSKTSLNIWKFTVHVLLKPGLENFRSTHMSVKLDGLHQQRPRPWSPQGARSPLPAGSCFGQSTS